MTERPPYRASPPTLSRRAFAAAALLGTAAVASSREVAEAATGPRRPFPHRMAYPGAKLRGPSHRSPSQQATDIAAYDRWKQRFVAKAGKDAAGRPLF